MSAGYAKKKFYIFLWFTNKKVRALLKTKWRIQIFHAYVSNCNTSFFKKQFHSVKVFAGRNPDRLNKNYQQTVNLATVYNPILNNLRKVMKNNLPSGAALQICLRKRCFEQSCSFQLDMYLSMYDHLVDTRSYRAQIALNSQSLFAFSTFNHKTF